MMMQLTTDLCRTLKHDLMRFDNDASACYDRIIVALGMMAAKRCGMPDNAILLHSEALQTMKYSVKTVYGISESNYQGTAFEPLFGTGQGSGNSPIIWCFLSSLLFDCYKDRTEGAGPVAPLRDFEVSIVLRRDPQPLLIVHRSDRGWAKKFTLLSHPGHRHCASAGSN